MQGGVGVALLLVAAIYFGAALFRRKFLSFFFDQLKTVSERQAAWFAREQQREAGGYVQRLGQLMGLARDWAVLRGAGLPLPGLPKLRWRRGAGADSGEGSPASAPDGVPMPAPAPESAAGEGVRSESSRGPTLVFISLGGGSEEGGGFGGRPASPRPGAFRGPVVDLGPDGYTVLAGDLAPATVEDSRPEGAVPAALAGEGEPRAVRPAGGDAENAVPRRLAAGVYDLGPGEYAVLAGGLAPERAAGPAGERFAPPPDGVPPGFGREERNRDAHGSGAKGETGTEGAAAGPPRPAQGAPAVRGGLPVSRAEAGRPAPAPASPAAPGDRPESRAAGVRRLSPSPVFPGSPAPSERAAAGPTSDMPIARPGGREAAARPPEPAADAASAPQPAGREPEEDRPGPAAAVGSSGRSSAGADARGFGLDRAAASTAGPAPAGREDAGRREESGGADGKPIRGGVRGGAPPNARDGRALPRVPPRLAAGVPQEPGRPGGSGSGES